MTAPTPTRTFQITTTFTTTIYASAEFSAPIDLPLHKVFDQARTQANDVLHQLRQLSDRGIPTTFGHISLATLRNPANDIHIAELHMPAPSVPRLIDTTVTLPLTPKAPPK